MLGFYHITSMICRDQVSSHFMKYIEQVAK